MSEQSELRRDVAASPQVMLQSNPRSRLNGWNPHPGAFGVYQLVCSQWLVVFHARRQIRCDYVGAGNGGFASGTSVTRHSIEMLPSLRIPY